MDINEDNKDTNINKNKKWFYKLSLRQSIIMFFVMVLTIIFIILINISIYKSQLKTIEDSSELKGIEQISIIQNNIDIVLSYTNLLFNIYNVEEELSQKQFENINNEVPKIIFIRTVAWLKKVTNETREDYENNFFEIRDRYNNRTYFRSPQRELYFPVTNIFPITSNQTFGLDLYNIRKQLFDEALELNDNYISDVLVLLNNELGFILYRPSHFNGEVSGIIMELFTIKNFIERFVVNLDQNNIYIYDDDILIYSTDSTQYTIEEINEVNNFYGDIQLNNNQWRLYVVSNREISLTGTILIEIAIMVPIIISIYKFFEVRSQNSIIQEYIQKYKKQSNEKLELLESKNTFLSNMSHEIRTPMNGVLGMIQLLEATELNEDQKKFVEICKKSSKSLLQILEDILLFSKGTANKLKIINKPFTFNDIIYNVIDFYYADLNDIEVVVEIEPELNNKYYISDPSRIRQIILNLISNAIKFTKKGEVVISVYVDKSKNKKDSEIDDIIIKIRDTGIGIKKDKQKLLFRPFMQVHDKYVSSIEGTGLGLSICKIMTDLLKGTISCESEYGFGSIFTVTLSLLRSKEVYQIEKKKIQYDIIKNRIKDVRIIAIDDNVTNCIYLEEVFKYYNKKVDCITDINEAIKKLNYNKYDVILLDYRMEMTGIELMDMTKQEHKNVILLTSYIDKDRIEVLNKKYIYKIIVKPVRMDELFGNTLKLIDEQKLIKEV